MLKGMIIWHCKYMHSLFLDKETPDTDFIDEVVVHCDVLVVKILLEVMVNK